METTHTTEPNIENKISFEDINRLLEVGRILFSVLTEKEIKELQELLSCKKSIGNAGDS